MRIHAMVTPEVLNSERAIRFVSYSRDTDSVFVMVTHAATWELRGMRTVAWDEFTNQFPETASIQFALGDHLVELSGADNSWSEVAQ